MMHRYHYLKRFTIGVIALVACFIFFQGTPYAPPAIDHSKVLRSLNSATLRKGKEIYLKACATCHGTNGTASLPQARSFNKDVLRFGNKPYEMWKTISNGAGMMAAQTWLSAAERYYVIQYIREEFMKPSNPGQYFKLTDKYFATLPKPSGSMIDQNAQIKSEAKKGSLQFGQQWFGSTSSDYGKALYTQVKGSSTSSLTISAGRQIFFSYDLHRMCLSAVWKGQFNLSDTKFKLYRGEGQPAIQGNRFQGIEKWQWMMSGFFDSLNATTSIRKPLDQQFMKYKGHYISGQRTILSYSISGRDILELPSAIQLADGTVIAQSLTISPGKEQTLVIGDFTDSNKLVNIGSWAAGKFMKQVSGTTAGSILDIKTISKRSATNSIFIAVVGNENINWKLNANNQLELQVPSSDTEMTFSVLRRSGQSAARMAFVELVMKMKIDPVQSLSKLIQATPITSSQKIVFPGQLNAARPHFDPKYSRDKDKTSVEKLVAIPVDYPYTVDNIPLPFDNKANAWIRPTAVAFMPDGRLLLTTYTGDLWSATGIDEKLSSISWQRIATGLYEPMGIKVINNEIFVTCRNGIMKLHDLNADDIIDYYEQYYADPDVSNFFHAFNFGLETDSKGNMYYVKPGEYTDNRDPGNVMKIGKDGSSSESIATGFRVNNGVTISPDDIIFVSDNQGNWTPANKLNVIENGRYYGYVPNLTSDGWSPDGRSFPSGKVIDGVISKELVPVPDTFAQPALWMPQEIDNSPGGGVWSDAGWGPLGNRLIHTSYGTGWSYYVLPKKVEGSWQASMIALPFQFDAGIQRAAVNPVDKQVYVTGLTGWDDGVAQNYGTLARIRYKGGSGHLIDDIDVVKEGISVRFNFKLDAANVDREDFDISMWNYKWTSNYGSAHYSVMEPGKEGEDKVAVSAIAVQPGQDAILINVPALKKANTMRIRMKIKGADGIVMNETIYLTINKIPGE